MNAIAASHCPGTLSGRSPVKPTPQIPALTRVIPKKMEIKAGERRTEMTVGLVVGIQLIGSSSALALDSSPTLNNLIYSLVAGFTVLLITGVALLARRKDQHLTSDSISKRVNSPFQFTSRDADAALFDRVLKKAVHEYNKEVEESGPREWLHPDGSFRSYRPPPNPHVLANRQKYASLVHWCRKSGGDEEYTKTGVSFRFGINCSQRQHKEYMNAIGLENEQED